MPDNENFITTGQRGGKWRPEELGETVRADADEPLLREEEAPGSTGAISRRRMLASLGMAGAALAAGGFMQSAPARASGVTAAVYGLGEEDDACCDCCVLNTTIAELRSAASADADAVYYVRDAGQEGHFRYDPADAASADNTGTVLVSASGLRFKRRYAQALNVKWFGAKGDGATDDTTAMQAAIDTAQADGATVYLPTGVFMISAPLVLHAAQKSIRIVGEGYGTRIRGHASVTPSSPLAAAIQFDDAKEAERYEFHDFTIHGETGKFQYGIYSAKISHTIFRGVRFLQTKVAGLGIGYGWCNDIETCEFSYNYAAGIKFVVDNVNMLNIVNSKIFLNEGIGIDMAKPGLGIRVNGCTLEKNKACAISIQFFCSVFDISDNYFEDNGATGVQFATPSRLIKSHIIVNGTNEANKLGGTYPCSTARIANNIVSVYSEESYVSCFAMDTGIEVSGNAFVNYHAAQSGYPVLNTGTNRTGASARVDHVRMYNNGVYVGHRGNLSVVPIAISDLAAADTNFYNASIQGVPERNYSPELSGFAAVVSSGGGTLAAAGSFFNGYDVYTLSGAANTDVFGFTIDVADYPRLAGKYVYFAVYVKQSGANMNAVAYTSQLGASTSSYSSITDWRLVSYVDKMPTSGTVAFGLRQIAASGASVLSVCLPVLKEVGAPTDNLTL